MSDSKALSKLQSTTVKTAIKREKHLIQSTEVMEASEINSAYENWWSDPLSVYLLRSG